MMTTLLSVLQEKRTRLPPTASRSDAHADGTGSTLKSSLRYLLAHRHNKILVHYCNH